MTLSYIFLTQSITGAVVSIVALCLVAAIIGYMTAWYYAKSVYTPIIKKLEEEKADLQKQVAGLKEEVARLNQKAEELTSKITKLEVTIVSKDKEISDLKSRIKE